MKKLETRSMKILVTGGAGYVGSILVPMLLNRGYEVIVLENFMYRQTSLTDCCADPKFTLVRGDCRDFRLMRKLLEKADVIIPLAAIVGASACERDKIAAKTVNCDAIFETCCDKSDRQLILYPMTNSGYGIGGEELCTEENPLRPVSLYGRLKVEAEKAVMERKNSISLRFATLFGASPRMRFDLLLNDFVRRAVRDKFVVLFEANFRRNYLHVRDAASAFLWAINHFDEMKGRTYNVGLPDANLTKLELCEKIKRYVPDFYFCEATIGEDPDKRDYLVSSTRILSTGWLPRYSLDDGIKELIKGYEILKGEKFGNV